MVIAAKKVKSVDVDVDIERVIPKIKCQSVRENWPSGSLWREFEVRLPEGLGLADLNEHADVIWRLVQGSPNSALVIYDRLNIFTFDESHYITAIVCGATGASVHLAGIKSHPFKVRTTDVEYNDGTYSARWMGAGYRVTRNADGVDMHGSVVQNLELAKSRIRDLYPKRIG